MARDRRDEDDERRRSRKRERHDDGDDEHRRLRKRDHRDDEDDHKRRDRHERKKEKKEKKEEKKEKKEKKKKKEHKRSHRHKKRLREDESDKEDASTPLPGGAPVISEGDYFLRATEFRVWLARSKGKYVEELSTDESTALFRDAFCRKWNRGKLPREYYTGLPDALVEQTRRTRHQWGFLASLGDRERLDLASAKDSVDVATRKTDLLASTRSASSSALPVEKERKEAAEEDGGGDDEAGREQRRRSWKRERRDRASDLEELVPKETGREARIEKRRQVASKMHGAARDREENRDGLDVSDEFLMGGKGGDGKDLARRLAQRDAVRRQRDTARQERLADLQAKESARMDKFLADMGLSGAGQTRMTIAPRPPPGS